MSSKERLSYDVPSPVLSLLASQGNTNMAQLTVIFVTTVPPLSPTTPLPPPSAYTNPLLPPLSHTYSENSPPSHFKTLLEGVHNNDFANEPTHLIISTHTHTGVSGVEECACPAISHNTISNCCLISNFPKLTITRNANITNTLVNSATLTGNVEIGHPEKMGHPQKVLAIEIGAESGGNRIIYVQTSKPTADSSMPALFHQFLAYDKKNPPAAPTPGSYVSDNYSVYLSPGAAITATSSVKSTILHNNATITACTTVTNTTLHENSAVSSCSPLSSLCVCDSSTITASSVTNTLLMAHSHVSDSHTMANSILGPSSHMSCGETHCSLLGPMCNQHHQSLLISVIAPHGRINVGYGANVGSNHTGRSADQECYLGEGCFVGLTTCIKFPFNLINSPYSLVAAGVSVPPSNVKFPFSLIAEQLDSRRGKVYKSTEIPPTHLNQLHPGWIFEQTLHTIGRNENKFVERQLSKEDKWWTDYGMFRGELVERVWEARERLRNPRVQGAATQPFYTKKEIKGLGANYCTEKGRVNGIEAYSFYIRLAVCRWIVTTIENQGVVQLSGTQPYVDVESTRDDGVRMYAMPWDRGTDETTTFKAIAVGEFPEIKGATLTKGGGADLEFICDRFLALFKHYVTGVRKSKARDDARGGQVHGEMYLKAHEEADEDKVVRRVKKELGQWRERVDAIKTGVLSKL